jgi:hypothetical protein
LLEPSSGGVGSIAHMTSASVPEDIDQLIERWMIAFCEIPPILDPDLMRRLLEEVDQRVCPAAAAAAPRRDAA